MVKTMNMLNSYLTSIFFGRSFSSVRKWEIYWILGSGWKSC